MGVLNELKRRRVFRVAVAYVVTAWLLLQVADILFPAFDAPGWTMRALVIVLAAGLPVALVLAWVFDLTPGGIRRTPESGDGQTPPVNGTGSLNAVIIGVLVAALALFAWDRFIRDPRVGEEIGAAVGERPSVAVLPFANFTDEGGQDPFANGLHDDLLTQLSKIDSIDVASRTSVMRYRDTEESIPDIGRALNVSTVLEGSVQRADDRLRFNAQLIDARTDRHLWAETYDRELTVADVFALQSEIARAVADALQTTLQPEELAALETVPTRELAAYDAFNRGRYLLRRGVEFRTDSIAAFDEAVRIDPEFASAWAGACEARLAAYSDSRDPAAFDQAERSCTRALTLSPDSAEVHVALGSLYMAWGDYGMAEQALKRAQLDKAEAALRAALDIDELAADAHIGLARVYARQGRLDEARRELERAVEVAPNLAEAWSAQFSFYYSFADDPDRFARAEAAAARAVELEPDTPAYWNNLGSARYMQENYRGASEAWRQSLELRPTRTAYTNTGLALYYAGDFEGAAAMQRQAAELAPDDHRPVGRLGEALAMLPDQAEAAREAFARAAKLVRESLAINDQDWQDWGMLSVYLARSGDAAGALDAGGRSLSLSDRRAEALFYVAQAQRALGQDEIALDLLEEAVRADPAYRELAVNEPAFQALADNPRYQAIIAEPAGGDD